MAEDGVSSNSRYVKLTKDQDAPMEEIRPGELNQPVRVPQVSLITSFSIWILSLLSDWVCLVVSWRFASALSAGSRFRRAIPLRRMSLGLPGSLDVRRIWIAVGLGYFAQFGRNVERIREDIPWTRPCVCHAICVEGGVALAAATALIHGIEPRTAFLIGEGLLFTWWMCGIYTGIFRQQLQKKYHLKNSPCDPCMVHCCMHWCANCQEHREMKNRLSENAIMPMTVVNPPPVQEMNMNESQEIPVAETGGEQGQRGAALEMHPL